MTQDQANPFGIVLPKNARLGQLSASMDALVKSVSWELGELYNSVLSDQSYPLGPDWLSRLRADRGDQSIKLHDPSFVFGEPEHYSSSVVWRALPARTAELVKLFSRARITRNYWQHRAAEQDLNRFGDGVRRYRDLCNAVGLSQSVEDCDRLLERIDLIRRQGEVRSGRDSSAIEEIKNRLADAEFRAEEAQKELSKRLQDHEQQKDLADAERMKLFGEIEGQRAELERTQEEARELAERIHGMLQEERLRLLEPAAELVPGEAWTVPLGLRLLDLQPRMVDLVDTDRRVLLSDEIGAVANQAARRWLRIMPGGGSVHLTDGGHAAGRVDGRFVYLGRLDETPDSVEMSLSSSPSESTATAPSRGSQSDQLVGYMYELTQGLDDVFEYATERLLSGFLGSVDARGVAEQLSGDIPQDEVFWTKRDGSVMIRRGGLMHKVGQIDMDYWFPVRRQGRKKPG